MSTKEIYLAGSTFWGGRDFIEALPGVSEAEYGLTDVDAGTVVETFFLAYPDSEFLGTTECLKVTYDPAVIPLRTLLEAFFVTVNPFSTEKQINYTTGMPQAKIFFTDAADEPIITQAIADLQQNFDKAVTVATVPLEGFVLAGKYADDYVNRNLGENYIVDPALAEVFVADHKDEFNI